MTFADTATISIIAFALFFPLPTDLDVRNDVPVGQVEIVEDEIEIEYIRPPSLEEIERAREYNQKTLNNL